MSRHDPRGSHDQNIKTIVVENPLDAITFALPQCQGFFRQKPEIIPIREESLKTFLTDSFVRSDVPLMVKYQNLAFIFLIEHQHDPYTFSIYQLSRYVSYLQEHYKLNVIPIVYFPTALVESKALVREIKCEFMGKRYQYFTYEAVVLKGFNASDYLDSSNVIARLMLPFMRFSSERLMEVLDSAIQGVLELVDSKLRLRQRKYLDFLLQYFKLDEAQWETYRTYKIAKKQEEVVDMVSTLLKEEGWKAGKEEGWKAGKEEGWKEGRLQQGREMLLKLLPKRLGPMPAEIENAIRNLSDLERVLAISDQLFEVKDWQEVEQMLDQ